MIFRVVGYGDELCANVLGYFLQGCIPELARNSGEVAFFSSGMNVLDNKRDVELLAKLVHVRCIVIRFRAEVVVDVNGCEGSLLDDRTGDQEGQGVGSSADGDDDWVMCIAGASERQLLPQVGDEWMPAGGYRLEF